MSKRKDGFNPVPSPDPDPEVKTDAAAEPVFDVKPVKTPAEAGKPAAPAAGPDNRTVPAEPDQPVFKFGVTNTFVRVEGGVRAASAEDARRVVAEWLTTGLEVRETAPAAG